MSGFDCRSCGACCLHAGPVPVRAEDDFVPRHLTRSIRDVPAFRQDDREAGVRMMGRRLGGRCLALRGEVGSCVSCAIYDRRPTACRTFLPGSEGCLAARAVMADKRANLDWRPRGYGPDPRTGDW